MYGSILVCRHLSFTNTLFFYISTSQGSYTHGHACASLSSMPALCPLLLPCSLTVAVAVAVAASAGQTSHGRGTPVVA